MHVNVMIDASDPSELERGRAREDDVFLSWQWKWVARFPVSTASES